MGEGDPGRQYQGGVIAELEWSVQQRIGAVIRAYEEQGFHRTGTAVDRISGEWLASEVREIGLEPVLEEFSLSRVDPIDASLMVNGRKIDGLPLFDGGFTGPAGIEGPSECLGSDAPIAFAELAPNAAEAGALGEARRQNRHRAIVVVTRGARPGFCPSNADSFLRPFGPPVLQVASEEASFLADCAREGAKAVLTAHAERTQAQAFNVVASVSGSNSERGAPGRDDAAKRMVELRKRARRRAWRAGWRSCAPCAMPGRSGTFCSSRQAVMSSVTSASIASSSAGRDSCRQRKPGFISAPISAPRRGPPISCRPPTTRWNR